MVAHPIGPGSNVRRINNYVFDPNSANLDQSCLMYTNFVNQTIKGSVYPEPTGVLLKALNQNLDFLHGGLGDCPQVFPYGKPQ